MMANEPEKRKLNRRTILKTLGAGTGATLGVSGTTAASLNPKRFDKKKAEKALDPYKSKSAVDDVIKKHGKKLLEKLSEISDEDITTSHLKTNKLLNIEEYIDESEGTHVSTYEFDGEYTARITRLIETKSNSIELFLYPQAEIYYLTSKPIKGDGDYTILESTSDGVEPQDFCQQSGYICKYTGNNNCCAPGLGCNNEQFEKIVCTSGRCYPGSHTGCCSSRKTC